MPLPAGRAERYARPSEEVGAAASRRAHATPEETEERVTARRASHGLAAAPGAPIHAGNLVFNAEVYCARCHHSTPAAQDLSNNPAAANKE